MSKSNVVVRAASVCLLLAACSGAPDRAASDASRLHRSAIVVDTHSDTTPWFQDPDWDFAERHVDGHMDLPRIREGGLDVQFWSIYMGRTEGEGRAVRTAIERMESVHRMAERYADQTEIAGSVANIRRIVASGKLASVMGIEGGHIIEDSLDVLRTYYRLGARYMTLTHSFHTAWADSSGTNEVPEPVHHGLTDFGREIVREMNRIGMMVDVSHVSDETFWDVIETSTAPIIASHSSARAIADHPRNLSDAMLQAVRRNGGVVMINFYPGYLDDSITEAARQRMLRVGPRYAELRERFEGDPFGMRRAFRAIGREDPAPTTSLDVLLDHFDHAIRVAGAEHVGIGADWDGVPSMPDGMEDVSKLPALTRGLLERGHSSQTVVQVLGGNLLRVMAQVERVSQATPRP